MNSASRQPSSAPLAGDVEDLVGGEEHRLPGALEVAGRRHEGAVVAPVAAQPGDRDEHLGRVGHDPGPPGRDQAGVADPRRGGAEPVQVLAPGGQQHGGLADVEGGAALGTRQRPSYLLGSGLGAHRAQASRGRVGRPARPGRRNAGAPSDPDPVLLDGLGGRRHGVLTAVQLARPPDPAAEVEVERGDQHRADDQVSSSTPSATAKPISANATSGSVPSTGNVAGEHQPGRGDHAAGGGQARPASPAGCRASGSPRGPGSSGRCCSRCPGRPGTRTRTAAARRRPRRSRRRVEHQRADAQRGAERQHHGARSAAAAPGPPAAAPSGSSITTTSTSGMITRLSWREALLDVEVDRRVAADQRVGARRPRARPSRTPLDGVERGLLTAGRLERAPGRRRRRP